MDALEAKKKSGDLTLHSKKRALKKAIAYHLRGIGDNSGLLYKSLERLSVLIGDKDPQVSLMAIDKIFKLLPYVVEREGGIGSSVLPGPGGTVNIQINNFEDFIKDKLSNTHLGEIFKGIQNIEDAKYTEIERPTTAGA